jgi:ubiquinone/menaquinone biosynthesis C-methylase UbiE
MSLFQNRVVPHLIHLAMSDRKLVPYRKRVLSSARGRVLEIGIGSGMNVPLYAAPVQEVIGLDPAPRLIAMAQRALSRSSLPVEIIEGSAEAIPLDRHSVDTVVTTWTLCSIPRVAVALNEMRRVLKPSGELLFVEHGLAPEASIRRWQDRLTPVWKCLGGGCHLNRPIRQLIEDAGFSISQLDTGYMKGPKPMKPMTFMYEGRASAR